MNQLPRTTYVAVFLGILFPLILPLPFSEGAYPPSEESDVCLGCHSDPVLSLTFGDGRDMPLSVDPGELGKSVHRGLDCTTCHSGFSVENHPARTFSSKREFARESAELCVGCHYFEKGIHQKMLAGLTTLLCTDCHSAHAVQPKEEFTDTSCAGCHERAISIHFLSGESESVHVSRSEVQASVHKKLACSDCHFGFSSENHPVRRFGTQRDLTLAASDICRRCHFDKYTKTLESIHYALLAGGNTRAPVCVDCHGSHGILSGRTEKVRSARRCEKCHEKIYGTYINSVHGNALLSEHNQDVPVCSDCHRAHAIEDPRTADFRNTTPEICGTCHANEELMARYGLSTRVLQSYLEDFHGVTVTFYKKQGNAVRHIAVCSDCHGIHDIQKTDDPDAGVLKTHLLQRCQKCHPDATENFPDAWISHYEPSLKRAPLVYAINLGYRFFIPFMIVGLVLQILLHIWRYAVNR